MNGTLYIVATPIGNLEDITYRAVRTLREVDLIACEDTRHTQKLLDHFGIGKPAVSYHEHNEQARSDELLAGLQQGKNIALVSDAGTPLIADPGYRLVAKARDAGIAVVPVPGPSAALAALSASGLPTDSFVFHGFLPAKAGQRRKALEQLASVDMSLVFYEAPHRILDTLEDIAAVLGSRPVVLARELTKIHEEFLRGTAVELLETLRQRGGIRGEFTIVVGKSTGLPQESGTIEEAVEELIRNGIPRMDALKQVARRRGISKREVYKRVL
jgi:16S rRNA (cytidine1402-2'-O)-methyltransferase